jgi:hypothetical protein
MTIRTCDLPRLHLKILLIESLTFLKIKYRAIVFLSGIYLQTPYRFEIISHKLSLKKRGRIVLSGNRLSILQGYSSTFPEVK